MSKTELLKTIMESAQELQGAISIDLNDAEVPNHDKQKYELMIKHIAAIKNSARSIRNMLPLKEFGK